MSMHIAIIAAVALMTRAMSTYFVPVAAFAHKPLKVEAPNARLGSVKVIPDHRVSWAIYEELGGPDSSAADYVGSRPERVIGFTRR